MVQTEQREITITSLRYIWQRKTAISRLHDCCLSMAPVLMHVTGVRIHHYTLHHLAGVLTLCGSYWSMVRTWRHSPTLTAHHYTLRQALGTLLLYSCFSTMARIFKHVTKIFGHHCTVHHPVRILMFKLCGSYWNTVRTWRQSPTTTVHHYILRQALGTLLLYSCFSTMAQIFKHVTKIFGHHCTVHHPVRIPMFKLCGSYWNMVRTWRQSPMTSVHHYILWQKVGTLLLYSCFLIMTRIFKHVAKIFGHHYMVHHWVGVPMLCGF